ncbi:MAG: penicillin-binding transpeptidase domain-containing protein [Acutalibacteraceae bacterium]
MVYGKPQKRSPRITVLCIMLVVSMVFFSASVANLHLYSSDYKSAANSTNTRTLTVSASRGQIVDRYGRPLAYNTDGYSVVFDRAYLPSASLNGYIIKLMEILTQNGESWIDMLPITMEEPYEFTSEEDSESMISSLVRVIGLNYYATAQNCMDEMIDRYKLSDYDAATQRAVMGVRFSMEYFEYSTANPYTFAENVGVNTMTVIEENSDYFKGVNIEVTSVRSYDTGVLSTHIVGTSGPIYAEEWEELSSKGYSYDDITGKSGIELAAEDYLHGINGTRKIVQDADGNVISNEITKSPVNGSTVMLTIDEELQQVAYNALEKRIKYLQSGPAPEAHAGAVVVIENATGSILASVTYPSYDMETYVNDYASLLENEDNPLFNRALMGTYEPGSTFKPATALAGLQSGAITAEDTITCVKKYAYYNDYQPTCTGYHGTLDVISAITYSCNYFFYEVGRRTGIETMNKYCRLFGLGVSTGVEISESTGVLAGPEYRAKLNSVWNPGDTIQAAIGQSDNLFSPLQLAVYTSSIANNGTRYKAHFIDSVYTYDLSSVVTKSVAEVLSESGISEEYYSYVKQGMHSVATDGTVSSVFRNFFINIGGKTGTAQVLQNGVMYNNALFISFAPYENPEISVAVVIEKGGYGTYVAQVAKEIYEYYFSYRGDTYVPEASNTLL